MADTKHPQPGHVYKAAVQKDKSATGLLKHLAPNRFVILD
jgi:hypothetical protein